MGDQGLGVATTARAGAGTKARGPKGVWGTNDRRSDVGGVGHERDNWKRGRGRVNKKGHVSATRACRAQRCYGRPIIRFLRGETAQRATSAARSQVKPRYHKRDNLGRTRTRVRA